MSRLHTINVNEATGEAADLFAAIKAAVGKVPNLYRTIGSNAPAVLAHTLQADALLKASTLSARELEAINLAVSQASECDYCVAAHTLMAKMAKYSAGQAKQLRSGNYPEDARLDALVRFAVQLVSTTGTLPASAVGNLREAGFTDRQIVEAVQAVGAILFTNMINRVNDTVIDFPAVD